MGMDTDDALGVRFLRMVVARAFELYVYRNNQVSQAMHTLAGRKVAMSKVLCQILVEGLMDGVHHSG